jgi:hypothetical protein
MAALESPMEGRPGHPSSPARSETPVASTALGPRTPAHTVTGQALGAPFEPEDHLTATGADSWPLRSQASRKAEEVPPARPAIASPIKRKPVAQVTIQSPTVYSPRDPLGIAVPLEAPEHRFSRSLSAESPTLYYFAEGDEPPASSTYSPISRMSEDSSANQ